MRKFTLMFALVALVSLLWAGGSADATGHISPPDAKALLAKDKKAVLLDVRTAEEYAAGHIDGAKLLPYDSIDRQRAAAFIGNTDTTVIVYCRSGRRSDIAAKTLRDLGYTKVFDLGAISAWPYGTVTGSAR